MRIARSSAEKRVVKAGRSKFAIGVTRRRQDRIFAGRVRRGLVIFASTHAVLADSWGRAVA